MIIIKSQDGIILEVKQINPSGKQIVSGIFNEEVSDGMGGTIDVINYLTLGMYKTEKRACEVMEMIEKHINELLWYKFHGADLPLEMTLDKYIFTMPEE